MTSSLPARIRSLLFVPGSKPERFDKALASGADAVILDLEDAVAPHDKDGARDAIARYADKSRPILVRVNARGTPWFEQDAALCRAPGIIGIVLPKTEDAGDVSLLTSLAGSDIPVFPLIESALGMHNVEAIARAAHVRQLMFGTLDFMADMNLDLANVELNLYRAQLTAASRRAGIEPPIDGVSPDLADVEGLARDALNGKRWGFAGKLCIHPRQIATVNSSFLPSAQEVDWARRVFAAFDQSAGSAVAVDGAMVDRPVMLRAEAILVLSGQSVVK